MELKQEVSIDPTHLEIVNDESHDNEERFTELEVINIENTVALEEEQVQIILKPASDESFESHSKQNHQLSNLEIIKETTLFSLKITLTQLDAALSGFACSIMFTRLSDNAAAANALIAASRNVLMSVGRTPLISVSLRTSQLKGEGKKKELGIIFRQGIVLGIISYIPPIIAFAVMRPLLNSLGQPATATEIVESYYRGHLVAAPLYGLYFSSVNFAMGLKQQNLYTVATLIRNTVFPIMGALSIYIIPPQILTAQAQRLGYSNAMSFGVSCLFLCVAFAKHPSFRDYQLFRRIDRTELVELMQLFKTGWPLTLNVLGEFASNFITTLFAGQMGEKALVATNISSQYNGLGSLMAIGLLQTTQVLVRGANSSTGLSLARRYGNASIGIGFAYSALFLAVLASSPQTFVSLSLNNDQREDTELVIMAKNMLLITTVGQIFEGFRRTITGGLGGLGDTKVPVLIDGGLLFLFGLPASYLLGNTFGLGVYGLALGNLSAFALSTAILAFRWRTKSTQLAEQQLPAPTHTTYNVEQTSIFQKAKGLAKSFFNTKYTFFYSTKSSNNNNQENIDLELKYESEDANSKLIL